MPVYVQVITPSWLRFSILSLSWWLDSVTVNIADEYPWEFGVWSGIQDPAAVIIDAMRAQPSDPVLTQNSLDALANLASRCPETVGMMVEAGVLDVIKTAMETHKTEPQAQAPLNPVTL